MVRGKSKVVWVKTNIPSLDRLANSPTILQQMVEAGLQELTDSSDLATAWSRYFHPKDIVGIP